MKPRVVLDANVLYGQTPRDTFMHLAAGDAIEARWTNLIHEEWIGNLLQNRDDLTRPILENVRSLMDRHASNSLVEGFEPLIETLHLPDESDRHVLAAAIHSRSSRIITLNLKDFPAQVLAQHNIIAQPPDAFLCELLREEAPLVLPLIATQRGQLRRPSRSVEEHLATLKRHGLSRFALALEPFQDQL